MTEQTQESITQLLDASRDDLETMLLSVNDRTFGFHCQQTIEKLLKVLITARGGAFEFTHDLEKLLNHPADLGESVPVPPALSAKLILFAGRFRYTKPDAFGEDERAQLIRQAETLKTAVLARLAVLHPSFVWPAV